MASVSTLIPQGCTFKHAMRILEGISLAELYGYMFLLRIDTAERCSLGKDDTAILDYLETVPATSSTISRAHWTISSMAP